MKFNPADYDDRAVMVLNSESQAAVFGGFLDSLGFHWCSGDSYIERHPVYDDQTYYRFKAGTRGRLQNAIDESYTILYFDDFDWTDEPEAVAISIDEVL